MDLDPTAALAEILELSSKITWAHESGLEEVRDKDAARLAELSIALDGWIREGRELPSGWQRS